MFREGGLPHQLLVVTDLTRALREEELQAWQRLVRVLGHELNNSLAPIKSIAGSLESLVKRDPLPDDWREDASRGFSIIATRSEGLSRFHGRLRASREIASSATGGGGCRRVDSQCGEPGAAHSLRVSMPGPEMTIQGDRDQLEQLLINLLRNAVDASLETGGGVAIAWTRHRAHAGSVDRGRRTRPFEHREPVRAVLHHQAGRIGNRSGAQPPDRGGARRIARFAQPAGCAGMPGAFNFADLIESRAKIANIAG